MQARLWRVYVKPERAQEAVELARALAPEVGKLEGIRLYTVMRASESVLLVAAIYATAAAAEAAAPRVRELFARTAELAAAPPEAMTAEVAALQLFGDAGA